jgi:hypothetical protein
MTTQNSQVNAIVAEALKNAGVTHIDLPAESELGDQKLPNPDGTPKGDSKGNELDNKTKENVTPAKPVTPAQNPVAPRDSGNKDELAKLIAESQSKIQQMVDKKMNALTSTVNQVVDALQKSLQAQEEAKLSGLPPEEQRIRRIELRLEQKEKEKVQSAQPIESQPVTYGTICLQAIDAAGLSPDDKRLDWATEDGVTLEVGLKRLFASVKKALVEDQTKAIQDLKNGANSELKKVRRKAGVDKIDNSNPSSDGILAIDKLSPIDKIRYHYDHAGETNQ